MVLALVLAPSCYPAVALAGAFPLIGCGSGKAHFATRKAGAYRSSTSRTSTVLKKRSRTRARIRLACGSRRRRHTGSPKR